MGAQVRFLELQPTAPAGSRSRYVVAAVVEAASDFGADVIVVGCQPRRLAHHRQGLSLRARLTRACELPLGLTRTSGGTLHVVCAVTSGSATSRRRCPRSSDTQLGAAGTEWFMSRLKRKAGDGVRVTTHAVMAKPAEAVSHIATREHADLIGVGSGSSHGARRLSAVPKAVLDRAPCAVLVV